MSFLFGVSDGKHVLIEMCPAVKMNVSWLFVCKSSRENFYYLLQEVRSSALSSQLAAGGSNL